MKTTAVAVFAALISFLTGAIWVFVSAEMFVQYFYEARMVALTHVFTLGWVSLMIVGVLRQLAPAAFGLKLRQVGLLGLVVALWIPGLMLMVTGFGTLRYRVAAGGTSLLVLAVTLFLIVLLASFREVRREMPHHHLLAALLYFGGAVLLGGWMGLAKGLDVALPAAFHRVLFAHIHLAGAGWAGMMIFAVLSRLFPQPHLRHPVQARVRFILFNIGLMGLSAGLLLGGEWYPLFGSALAVACIWYAAAFIPVIREFGQPSDRSTVFIVSSWSCLIVVALTGLWFNIAPGIPTAFTMQLQFAYGFIYMFGWLSLMILGMLYRIIPTHISKFLTSRGMTATASMRRALVDPDLQIVVLIALLAGLAVSSTGILIENVRVFRVGWSIWLCGIAGFAGGLFRLGAQVRSIVRSRYAA